jgi:xylulose-5-phosphate/fructose-6-phosphate phosphoketolase
LDNNQLYNENTLVALSRYLRLANYIGAAQLYLKDNYLLEQPLDKAHIKKRILGHWGTVPGLNFIYANLNLLAKRHNQEIMLVVGPGHGYPAVLANLYIESTLGDFYPEYKHSKEGFEKLIKNFSWPGGFPSHSNPETPGAILEGGELGYSLSTAYGASFDNPDLLVACVVGDGEAETGPLSSAWQTTKFINPREDGSVLPIVHVNKYKISGPTIFGTMSDTELYDYFYGQGMIPFVVSGDKLYEPMIQAVEDAYQQIKKIKANPDEPKPRWPVVLLVSKKGWTGPEMVKGLMNEDSFRSHGIPLEHVHDDPSEFLELNEWLQSYKVRELLDENYKPAQDILDLLPDDKLLIGKNRHANLDGVIKNVKLPSLHSLKIQEDELLSSKQYSNMNILSDYLRDVVKDNPKNFRIMSPDETESNKLGSLFEVTNRRYNWPVPVGSEHLTPDGRIMEILSEHNLQGWLEGYVLTGRHGVFITYEAFAMIVASMIDQYTKFLKQAKHIEWRQPVPSLNLILTSNSWRQDHNGFSHQNPGLISSVLNDYSNIVHVHFPVDANMLLVTMEEALSVPNKVNLIIAGKRENPQYMTLEDARKQMQMGIHAWDFIGNESENPDIIFTATGDYPTKEVITTIQILKEDLPELKTKFVSVSEITCFGIGDHPTPTTMTDDQFHGVFSGDVPIIYLYHGYPEDIKQLIFGHSDAKRFTIHGYKEKGTTTTPFDMLVQNDASRYQMGIEAIEKFMQKNPTHKEKSEAVIKKYQELLDKHHQYIKEHGVDIPEVTEFKFKF